MAPGAPPARGGDRAAHVPTSQLERELQDRSAQIVAALSLLVDGSETGRPLRGEDLIMIADQIRDLRDALNFADVVAPLT